MIQRPKSGGTFPATTHHGSARWKLAAPDFLSAAKFATIAMLTALPANLIAFGEEVWKAAVTAAAGVAVGAVLKLLQRLISDTR